MSAVMPPASGDSWLGLTPDELPLEGAIGWASRADCGAVVSFSGTVRDHSAGRPGVHRLSYEAYEGQVIPCLEAVEGVVRERWPAVRRVVMLHRVGDLEVGESAVVVVVSSPHRDDAFEAARFAIDELKATAPIWKREAWDGGDDWGAETQPVRQATSTVRR